MGRLTPRLIYIIAGVWTAAFAVGAWRKQGSAYLAPLGKLFDFSHGWENWAANATLVIPNMAMVLLLIGFAYMTTTGSGLKDRALNTLGVIALHIVFSPVTSKVVELLPDWAVNYVGPALGVAGAFALYLWAKGVFSGVSGEGVYILGGVWVAGFFVATVKSLGAGYFTPISAMFGGGNFGTHILNILSSMGLFILLVMFSWRTVQEGGMMGRIKGTGAMMVLHLAFSQTTSFLVDLIPNFVLSWLGSLLSLGVAFALYLWAEGKRG